MSAWTKETRRSPGLRKHTRSVRGGWSGLRWSRWWTAYAPTRVSPTWCVGSDFRSETSRMTMLDNGTKLGRYEIRSKIGAGGMGEVYLAQDTELDRKVALKVLPASFASDADRLRQFVVASQPIIVVLNWTAQLKK